MTQTATKMKIENIKPEFGAIVHIEDRDDIFTDEFAKAFMDALDERGVLVLPKVNMTDEEMSEFTNKLGERVNFTKTIPGGDAEAENMYTITLDKEKNPEPEYVLGTFFWHMDGVTIDGLIPPKANVLACRRKSPTGGQTQFASTVAAYEALSDEEKAELADLRVKHSVAAAVREVASRDTLDPMKAGVSATHPLVWKRGNGSKSLVIGYTADEVVGMPKAHGRALLMRLLEWAGQPRFTYSHDWQEGDLVVWDNTGALHRVIPYDETSGRSMQRTSVAGVESVS